MADASKRQSAGPRTTTPKPGVQGPGDVDEAFTKAIGARVKVTTSGPFNITLEGTLYTACRMTSMLAINSATIPPTPSTNRSAQHGDYHLIPFHRVETFDIISRPNSHGTAEGAAVPSLARVDVKAMEAREKAALRKIKEKDATRGKNVSKEAQELFEALNRTLPTRWHDTSIVVNDAVMIVRPYGPENCTAPEKHQAQLVRVKKVVEHERKKIAEKASKVAVATPLAGGVRKGG